MSLHHQTAVNVSPLFEGVQPLPLPPATRSHASAKRSVRYAARAIAGQKTTATVLSLPPKKSSGEAHRSRATKTAAKSLVGPTLLADANEDANTLSDQDLSIRLLSRCLSLTDAAHATEAILKRYSSFADAVAAPIQELLAIPALGEKAAILLKCVHTSVARLTSMPLRQAPVLNNWLKLSAYLNVSTGRERNEICRVLFLNAKNHLICDQVFSEGEVNSVQVPVRAITKRALDLGATALLLVHNHPSGDPTPSDEDIAMTERIKLAVSIFGIVVHDHIIVGTRECFSFKSQTYMTSYHSTDGTGT